MKEDDIAKGQMSVTREKDQKENLEKCHFHLCHLNKRGIIGPPLQKKKEKKRNENQDSTQVQKAKEVGCQNAAEETGWKSVQWVW